MIRAMGRAAAAARKFIRPGVRLIGQPEQFEKVARARLVPLRIRQRCGRDADDDVLQSRERRQRLRFWNRKRTRFAQDVELVAGEADEIRAEQPKLAL